MSYTRNNTICRLCLLLPVKEDCLLSLSNMFLKVLTCLFTACSLVILIIECFVVWVYHGMFIHSPIEGHLVCLLTWAIINEVNIRIHVQVLGGNVSFQLI